MQYILSKLCSPNTEMLWQIWKATPFHFVLKFQIYGSTWTEWALSLFEFAIMYGLVQPALHCVDHTSQCKPKYITNQDYEILFYVVFAVHAISILGPLYGQISFKTPPQLQYLGSKYTQCKWVLIWNTLLILILKASNAVPLCISAVVLSYVAVLIPLHFSNFFLAT